PFGSAPVTSAVLRSLGQLGAGIAGCCTTAVGIAPGLAVGAGGPESGFLATAVPAGLASGFLARAVPLGLPGTAGTLTLRLLASASSISGISLSARSPKSHMLYGPCRLAARYASFLASAYLPWSKSRWAPASALADSALFLAARAFWTSSISFDGVSSNSPHLALGVALAAWASFWASSSLPARRAS